MKLTFTKYHGTGNDFIIIDNRAKAIQLNTQQIAFLCHRHFGIGADGLMLLEPDETSDFKMVYYNSDGNESTMCGNGGRCLAHFAHTLGIWQEQTHFIAIDGPHQALKQEENISLEMQSVDNIETHEDGSLFLNTGSPHHVIFVKDVAHVDVNQLGAEIRYSNKYAPNGGTNVNFVQILNDGTIKVRTYERGVENETLSCGTGVTAAAIATHFSGKSTSNQIKIETPGGHLAVRFEPMQNAYQKVWLTGPAVEVFQGTINL